MKKNRKPTADSLRRLSYNMVRLRKARGYNQADLGRRCGMSKGHINNIEQETRNVSLATIEALCGGLVCSIEDLFMKIPATPLPNKEDPSAEGAQWRLPSP